jgi:hypothetical protein
MRSARNTRSTFIDVAGHPARGRIGRIVAEHVHPAILQAAAAAALAADDVVVEDGLDFLIVVARFFRVQSAAEQSFFLAREGDEDQGLVELIMAQDARQLHHAGRAAAVVGDAGLIEIRIPIRRCDHKRVVVRADDDPLIIAFLPRQHRDHVVQAHVAGHTRRLALDLLDLVFVEADLQARAVAAKLLVNPLARRADPACRMVLGGEQIARAEALQLLDDFRDAVVGNLGDDFRDLRIHGLVLSERRSRRGAAAQHDPESHAFSRLPKKLFDGHECTRMNTNHP